MTWTPQQLADFQSRGIQIDAQGRPFAMRTDPGHQGEPLYLNPATLANPQAGTGGIPNGPQGMVWNGKDGRWVPKADDKLQKWLMGATIAGLTAGVGSAAGLLGGAGGGASGASAGGGASTASGVAGGAGGIAGGAGAVAGGGMNIPNILDLLKTGGGIAGAFGRGREEGRQVENDTNWRYDQQKVQAARLLEDALSSRANYGLNRDQLKLSGAQFGENSLMNRGQLDLQQRQFGLDAPRARARNALSGDTLANNQDVSVSGARVPIPQISGGLRPSMRSADTMALGREMSRSALASQMQGDSFEKLPDLKIPDVQDYQFPAPSIPQITPPQQPGALDTGLNIGGLVGDAFGLYDEYRKRRQS